MPIVLAAHPFKSIKLGDHPFKKVFIGNDLVWSSNPEAIVTIDSGSTIRVSYDNGTTWTAVSGVFITPGISAQYARLFYYDKFVAAQGTSVRNAERGDITFAQSEDGTNWTIKTLVASKYGTEVTAITAYENHIWVACKYGETTGAYSYYILHSSNGGTTFEQLTAPTSLTGLAYGNGLLIGITVGSYRVYYSSDQGATWTQTSAASSNVSWKYISFDGTQFFISGQHTDNSQYYLYYSTGGTGWAGRQNIYGYYMNKIGNYYLLSSGTSKNFIYTTDLAGTFTQYTFTTTASIASGIVYTGTKFVLIAYYSTTGYVFQSDSVLGTYTSAYSGSPAFVRNNIAYSVNGGTA